MRLSPRHRELLELVGREQLSYPKAAKRMGIHLSTVQVYVSRICEREGSGERPRKVLTRLYWTMLAPSGEDGN